MRRCVERSEQAAVRQAHSALRRAAIVIAPAMAAAEAGLVVLVDIVAMRGVNARHGVATGDRLLAAVDDSLCARFLGAGVVARLAGDQFVVVIPGEAQIEPVVEWVRDAVARTRVRGRWGRAIVVEANVGAATWNDQDSRHTALAAAGVVLRARPGPEGDRRPRRR